MKCLKDQCRSPVACGGFGYCRGFNFLEIGQHLGWLKQYMDAMTEQNWKDMRLLAIRQLAAIDEPSSSLTSKHSPGES